ncbi:uncharacterized protein SEPMUDRAFT_53185, partial [Sphaerulina musiva SO2202]
GATNSVSQFIRVITRILIDYILYRSLPFLDDISIKRPKTNYSREELKPSL